MIEASDDATWDKKRKDGMALNDAMYMCNVVARRAVWQPTFPPVRKIFLSFLRAKFLFSTYRKKIFDLS